MLFAFVPPALDCIDGCFFFYFTSFDSLAYCLSFSTPPFPEKKNNLILFKLKN